MTAVGIRQRLCECRLNSGRRPARLAATVQEISENVGGGLLKADISGVTRADIGKIECAKSVAVEIAGVLVHLCIEPSGAVPGLTAVLREDCPLYLWASRECCERERVSPVGGLRRDCKPGTAECRPAGPVRTESGYVEERDLVCP